MYTLKPAKVHWQPRAIQICISEISFFFFNRYIKSGIFSTYEFVSIIMHPYAVIVPKFVLEKL